MNTDADKFVEDTRYQYECREKPLHLMPWKRKYLEDYKKGCEPLERK